MNRRKSYVSSADAISCGDREQDAATRSDYWLRETCATDAEQTWIRCSLLVTVFGLLELCKSAKHAASPRSLTPGDVLVAVLSRNCHPVQCRHLQRSWTNPGLDESREMSRQFWSVFFQSCLSHHPTVASLLSSTQKMETGGPNV